MQHFFFLWSLNYNEAMLLLESSEIKENGLLSIELSSSTDKALREANFLLMLYSIISLMLLWIPVFDMADVSKYLRLFMLAKDMASA